MTTLDEYADRYPNLAIERREGILQLTIHTDGGPLRWSERIHRDLGNVFTDIGADAETKVVIITGAGDAFCTEVDVDSFTASRPGWEVTYWQGKRLLLNLLDIPVPVISAVNGPATIHADLLVVNDIVLAAESAAFGDLPHFGLGIVPGDGSHLVWPLLLGMNRGRYFLLSCQTLSASEALELGVVNEILPGDELLPRAWELAAQIAVNPTPMLRYTRAAITIELRRLIEGGLGYGLALEGLANPSNSRSPSSAG